MENKKTHFNKNGATAHPSGTCTHKRLYTTLNFLTAFFCCLMLMAAQEAAGQTVTGSGTDIDPYIVKSWGDLKTKMAEGGYIRLDANVSDPDKTRSSYLNVPSGVTVVLDLNGRTIDRALTAATSNGYVISLSGNLTINDSSNPSTGSITGGWNSSNYGGCVYLNTNSTFTLNNGSITGNKIEMTSGEAKGGAIFVGNNATFTMNGGSITNNSVSTSSSAWGGAVCVHSYNSRYGTFNMNGGSITGNSVSGNSSSTGGGVYITKHTSSCYGRMNVSGNVTITGNTANSAANNVYIPSGPVITISDALNAATRIGITAPAGQTITSGLNGKGSLENFSADDPESIEIFIENNEVKTVSAVVAVEAKAPTCTEPGISQNCWRKREGTQYYSDQACTNEIFPLIPPLGHDMTHHAATAATADAFGNIEYWTCSRCGKYFTDSEGKTETTFGAVTTHDYGVSYIDEHGEQQTCTEFTFIESSNEDFNHYGTEGETNWYVVYGNVTINGQLNFDNYNTHLIICDGATLNISDGAYVSHSKNYLSIYGQAEGSGSIDANGDRGISALGGVTINGGTVTAKGSSNGIYSHYGVTINGGTVTATGSDNYESAGIYGSVITINGGIVTAKGNRDGISAGSVTINGGTATAMGYGLGIGNYDGVSTITLGWTDTTDRITSTATGTGGVSYKGTVSIKDGQYLYDGTEVFSGTVADLTKLQNVTLQPAVKITLPTFVTASGTGVINQADGTYALPGATVTLGAAAGYTASDYSITGVTINEAEGVYTFTMPAKDVEVSATCTSISLTANLAALNGVTKYWTTFYHPTLSYQLPAGAMALYMKEDMALYMLGDGDVVPAGTPVIIMGDTSSISITKLDSTTVTNPTDNKLSGTAVATAASSLTTGGKKVYVMSKVNETLGFYEFSGTTIPANKAYYY